MASSRSPVDLRPPTESLDRELSESEEFCGWFMKRKKSYCTPSVVTNFPESRKSPNGHEPPQTQNRAIIWQFGIIKAHSHKKNELRGVRNKKVRCGGIFFVYATFFVSMQHTLIKLNGNGLLSSKALQNRSQNCWGVSQTDAMIISSPGATCKKTVVAWWLREDSPGCSDCE